MTPLDKPPNFNIK